MNAGRARRAGFRPYAWASGDRPRSPRGTGCGPSRCSASTRTRRRFPACRRCRSAESFAGSTSTPTDLPRAARGRGRVRAASTLGAGRRRRGRGRPDPALRPHVPRPGPARRDRAADLRAVPDRDGARRRRGRSRPDGAAVIWRCNPNNPTGELSTPAEIVELARATRTRRSSSTRRTSSTAARPWCRWSPSCPNLIVLRTMSKAFGFAALRVGYAVAAPEVAAELEARRRAGAASRAPAARIAAAALREPRFDVEADGRRARARRAALAAAGYDCPPAARQLRLRADGRAARRPASSSRGSSSAASPRGSASRCGGRARTTSSSTRSAPTAGAASGPRRRRVIRTSTETALRITLELDGSGRARIATGIGFLDHLLTLLAFHAGFDLDCVAGGDLDVDEHHTVEDVLAALGDALTQALGDPRRRRALRLGVRADGRGARDGRGRPRPAPARRDRRSRFAGDRVGGLAPALLPHALERFAMRGRAAPSTSKPRAATTITSPRPRSRRSAGRCGQACARGGGGRPLDEGASA